MRFPALQSQLLVLHRWCPTVKMGLICLLTAALPACNGTSEPNALNSEEQQIVAELLAVYRTQLLELAEAEGASALREELRQQLGTEELADRLRSLSRDPERAALVMEALEDSLEGVRDELLALEAIRRDEEHPESIPRP